MAAEKARRKLKMTPATGEELAEVARANGVETLDQEPKGVKTLRFAGPGALLAHLERAARDHPPGRG